MTSTSELASTDELTNTDEIASEIQSCINTDGTLILPGDALNSATMATAFEHYLTDDSLIVFNALIQTTDDSVTVSGNGGGRFSELGVNAEFIPTDSGDIAVVVTGVATEGWIFPLAFSSLATGVYDTVPVAGDSLLRLRTLADGDLAAGLWFDGALLISGELTGITSFLNGTDPLAISGAIDVVSGIPDFAFSAVVNQDMTVGTLVGLNFTLNSVSSPYLYEPYDDASGQTITTYTQDAYLSLTTTLSFEAKGEAMSAAAEMRFGTGVLICLRASFDGSLGVLLEDFLEWAGGDLFAGMPPPSLFDPSDYLTLDDLNFSVLKSTAALSTFDLAVSTKDEWVVIPDLITITKVSQTLTSMAPAGKATITGLLTGNVDLGKDGSVAKLVLNAGAPDFTFWGQLEEGCVVIVSDLVTYLIPTAVGIPTITLELFGFCCQPSGDNPTYSIEACFESDWVLDLSPIQMAITDASIDIAYGPIDDPVDDESGETVASTTSGNIGGSIVFNDTVKFDIDYTIPGEFDIRGEIERLSLSESITRLVNMDMPLPDGFDLVFTNCYVSICYGSGEDATSLEFQIGAEVEGLGSLAFDALKVGGLWGYATGLSMGNVSLSNVPGLSSLKPFDAYFAFKKLVFVVSTADLSHFTFPDASVFDGGTTTNSSVVLPTGQGVVAGMNAYADIDLASQKELSLLQSFLHLSGELSITLQVGLEDVETGSALYVTLAADINSNLHVDGSFGAKLIGGVLDLYMTGEVTTVLQGQDIVFDFTLTFVPNGAFMSGGYQGTIDFVIVKLSNLILEIGVDWEGLPTIGFGAQIDVADYESSVMVLLNSAVPTQSMFIASVSDLTLATTLNTLCNLTDTSLVPDSLMSVLEMVGLSGTNHFTLEDTDDTVSVSLNNRDVNAVSQAFATAGISLPSDSLQVIISVADSGTLWHVTDMVSVLHYRLTKEGSGTAINGTLDPQLYVVPQDTMLGVTTVQEGLRLNGRLDLFGFYAELTVYISDSQGFWIEAEFSKIAIKVSGDLIFSFESADGTTGPSLSVCTYQNNQATEPDKQPPHFFADGAINVLGVVGVDVTMNFTETGGNFDMSVTVDGAKFSLGGSYNNAYQFATDGSADVGVDATMDFGSIGKIHVVTSVGYAYEIEVTSATTGTASASGHFDFEGVGFEIPRFTLDLSTDALANLVNDAVKDVEKYLGIYLADYQQWLNWLYDGVILGVDTAEQVGEILAATYELDYDTIATQTTEILHYGSDQVADALDGAGATADETLDILVNTLDYSVDDATKAVEQAFSGVHCDVQVTPHEDAKAVPHEDSSTHTDEKVPHGDAVTIPHTDNKISSHSDSKVMGIHSDIPGIHEDTAKVHTDTPSVHSDIPIHGDTPAIHTDIPAVHTDLTT
jgi:hypothetical protein